jgi:hypothetical protein
MKKMFSYLSVAALAAGTAFITMPGAHASALLAGHAAGAPAAAFGQEPWETPPSDLQGAEQQGFHDGIEGARKDVENHRPPSPENRDEFRHPPVPHHDWRAYRRGFRRGYRRAMEHLEHHHD